MRFLLPVTGLAAAMLALCAGTFGDLASWRKDLPAVALPVVTPPTVTPPVVTPPRPEPPPETRVATATPVQQPAVTDAERDAPRRARELREQITRETLDLAALRASTEALRQELAALREQRDRMAANHVQVLGRRPIVDNHPSPPPLLVRPVTAPTAPAQQQPETAAAQTAPPVRTQPPALRNLTEARTALADGRGARARRLLKLARAQMSVRPSGQLSAEVPSDAPVMRVASAISLLNRGDSDGAMRAIDQALTVAEAAPDGPDRLPGASR